MIKTYLGKITEAEFGLITDYPFLMGLKLEFQFDGCCCVGDGGMYTINMSDECKWETRDRREAIEEQADKVYQLLNDAKCLNVSNLKGKPVQITLKDNTFESFRILTEVL